MANNVRRADRNFRAARPDDAAPATALAARAPRLAIPFLAALLLSAFVALLGANPALAQVDTGPLGGDAGQIKGAIDNAVLWGVTLAGSLAAAGLLWGGGLMMTAGANKERQQKGQRVIGLTLGGFLVVALAGGILALASSFVGG
ncbi:MAG: hypothetical protein M3R38_10985 [Actinomycetota bacterium]|nr:hypothetical protein [Actinomycetota bacterium]